MEAIAHLVALMDAGQTTFEGNEFAEASRAMRDLGWGRNEARPETPPDWAPPYVREKGEVFPWWVDPETGEDVRGFKAACRLAFSRYIEELATA